MVESNLQEVESKKGRDIVIQKQDELGDQICIAVQTKKIQWGENSGNRSFQTLLNQLSQASSEPIIRLQDGNEILATSFLFVTPYLISQRALDSHRGALRSAVNGKEVKILDGRRIVDLILKFRPGLLEEVFGSSFSLDDSVHEVLDDSELMSALGVDTFRRVKQIYCKAGFLFGGAHLEQFMNNRLVCEAEIGMSLSADRLQDFMETRAAIYDATKVNILVSPKLAKLQKLTSQIATHKKALEKLATLIDELSLSTSQNSEVRKFSVSAQSRLVIGSLDSLAEDARKLEKEIEPPDQLLSSLLEVISETADSCSAQDSALVQEQQTITISLLKLIESIEEEKVRLTNRKLDSIDEVREYLDEVDGLTRRMKFAALFGKHIEKKPQDRRASEATRLSLHQVFDTRKNIAVLGDAGSGKTTNLKAYAGTLIERAEHRFTFFASLSDICSAALSSDSNSILKGIVAYLQRKALSLTESHVRAELAGGGATVILDGIDEAVVEFGWVIDSIVKFGDDFPHTQLIVSSRFSIQNVDSIPFAYVSLLPFDRPQKKEFFSKWFEAGSDAPILIMKHLEDHPELDRIVVNPLSATILCVLCEGGVELPDSETALYKARFDLLAGRFDKAKTISRLSNSPDTLIDVSKFIAFQLHKDGVRFFGKSRLLDLVFVANRKISEKSAISIVYDLIKSEIVVAESENEYSFGHLRFQEYLASVELRSAREFPSDRLLRDPWWQDVMMLYAKEARSVDWIINYATANELAQSCKNVVRRMIAVRPESERTSLERRLNIAIVDERSQDPTNYELDQIDSTHGSEDPYDDWN